MNSLAVGVIEVWQVEFHFDLGVKTPDYGDHSQDDLMNWAQDSSLGTISVRTERQVTLLVQ